MPRERGEKGGHWVLPPSWENMFQLIDTFSLSFLIFEEKNNKFCLAFKHVMHWKHSAYS